MKMDFIKLLNYRQYRDEEIKFDTSEARGLTVIQGVNGTGKTNLLNAITWCLYGEEKHLTERYKGLPILNTITRNKLEPRKTCKVSALIQMRDEEGKKMMIGRTVEFQKLENGEIKNLNPAHNSSNGTAFTILKQVNKDMVEVEEPEYILKRLIPESIEEYFFFDGERLNDYFRSTSGEKIREAVFKISQVGLIENAIEHLENKKQDFVKRAEKLTPKTKEIREEWESKEKLLKEHKQQLSVSKRQMEEAQKKVDEYNEKLRASSSKEISRLSEERKEIEKELDRREEDINRLEKEKLDYLIETAPLIFAYGPIVKTKELIEKRKEAGDIPPDYKKSFLEKLLKNGKCICGADISKPNEHRKNIEKLLSETANISDISGELTEEYTKLKLMIESLKNFRNKQIDYGKRIREKNESRKRKSERLKKISEEIGNSDIKQIKIWEDRLEEYKKIKNNRMEKMAELRFYVKKEEEEVKKLDNQFNKELEKEKKNKELRKILLFCTKSLDALKRIKEEIMEDVQKEIEEKSKKYFFDLIWKKETYTDLKINSNYNISVIDQNGTEAIGTLSAGERQVLALSFMAALNSVSGFNVPIIIDTPLGRLSKEPKENIASNLLSYLKEKQLVLLVTDEEYTPEVRSSLSKRIGKEYKIYFRETKEGSESEVIPYEE